MFCVIFWTVYKLHKVSILRLNEACLDTHLDKFTEWLPEPEDIQNNYGYLRSQTRLKSSYNLEALLTLPMNT